MKNNNFENPNNEAKPESERESKLENKLESQPELRLDKQEVVDERDLENFRADFTEIKNDALEISSSPEASSQEKLEAKIWESRGKGLLLKGLAALSLAAPLSTEATLNNNISADNNKTEIAQSVYDQEKFRQEVKKYQEHGLLMACNLASEKPTKFQERQIKSLENSIIKNIQGKEFSSITEMTAYINQLINSDFSATESSLYIKDAFPEAPGEKAKGSFDCDTRSIITLSVLSKLGITGEQVELCLLEDHALLNIKKEDTFLEMTSNEPRQLNQDESLQVDRINSLEKYQAYLLNKEGVALASEADGNVISGEKDNREKQKLALEKLISASELDPYNLNNNLNLLKVLKLVPGHQAAPELVKQVTENIQRGLLNNYYNINTESEIGKTIIIQPQEITSQKVNPRRLEDLGKIEDLTATALRENEYLAKKFVDLGSDLFYDFNNPKAALTMFQSLAKSQESDPEKSKSTDYCFYQEMTAKCLFSSGQYDKYLSLAENELYMLLDENSKLKTEAGSFYASAKEEEGYKTSAAKLITGRVALNERTVDDFCKQYKDDPLLGRYISGNKKLNSSAIWAVTALEKWSGYQNMIKTLDEYRKKNTNKK